MRMDGRRQYRQRDLGVSEPSGQGRASPALTWVQIAGSVGVALLGREESHGVTLGTDNERDLQSQRCFDGDRAFTDLGAIFRIHLARRFDDRFILLPALSEGRRCSLKETCTHIAHMAYCPSLTPSLNMMILAGRAPVFCRKSVRCPLTMARRSVMLSFRPCCKRISGRNSTLSPEMEAMVTAMEGPMGPMNLGGGWVT